jgi:hypothetical protein
VIGRKVRETAGKKNPTYVMPRRWDKQISEMVSRYHLCAQISCQLLPKGKGQECGYRSHTGYFFWWKKTYVYPAKVASFFHSSKQYSYRYPLQKWGKRCIYCRAYAEKCFQSPGRKNKKVYPCPHFPHLS